MSATGLTTDAIKNVAANAYAGAALYITLLRALILQSAASAGATSISVDLSVQAGDILVIDQGLSTQEQVTVSAVSGTGPYTATVSALSKSHSSGAFVSHIPLTSSTVHEMSSITRVAANWTGPSPAGVITSSASAITIPSGQVLGSMALFSASTSGTYYDATAVTAQDFRTSGGSWTPLWVEALS